MEDRDYTGAGVVFPYTGQPCPVCGGDHQKRRCPELSLPNRGRMCIIDGPVFNAFQAILSAIYKDETELVVVEVRQKAR